MNLPGAARLFVYQALWRGLGVSAAGRALVRALGDGDDDVRTMAGMFLVQSGRRAVPLLREALDQRHALPTVLRIIGDIGASELIPEVERFAGDSDPAIAQAARDALRLLSRPRPG